MMNYNVAQRVDRENRMVSKVNLDQKTLNVVATWNPSNMFTLPITHFAHNSALSVGNTGGGGIFRLGDKDACMVELGAATLASLPPDVIIVKQVSHSVLGCDTTLAGTPLTPQELFDVDNVFEQGHITWGARTKTPPPTDSPPPDAEDSPMVGTSSLPWRVDDNNVVNGHLVSRGWRASYLDHHIKTKVPSPFQLPSGQPMPPNTLAVILTEQTKGTMLLHINIPENSLTPVAPPKKDTFCMIIESKEGGEEVGMVLSVTKSSKKAQTVEVKHLDGTHSKKNILPWSWVIMVKRS
ncbi:hypothetical protein BDN67DRAFT_986164 [Paxillus ammoniavirescens]|nr:hypothetical protein BDN67DRAFT_986164 [Paxillus ammoniavirescens]